MSAEKATAASPDDLRQLAENKQPEQLKGALSLLHSWGVRTPDYLPVLEKLLLSEDPEVLRLTLGIMLNFERGPRKHFLQLKNQLATLQKLATTETSMPNARFLALELIVKLAGPTQMLVPHLREFLYRWPEEASDVICLFGPLAKDLVPDLIKAIEGDDWDTTWALVDALGAIGPEAKSAVPTLTKLTMHKSGVISGRACVALEQITGKPRTSWPK